MSNLDEFAEVDTTEAEFDAMMAEARAVADVPLYHAQRWAAEGYYTLTRA